MKKNILLALVLTISLIMEFAKADVTFGEPMKVCPSVNSSFTDATPCISADGLNLYFASTRPGGQGGLDLWVAKRDSIDQSWSDPENLGKPVNTPAGEGFPSISTDSLSLYFSSNQSESLGGGDIWVTTRSSIEANWSKPVNLGPNVNSPSEELACCISPDNTELFISSNRPGGTGGYDLYVARRATTDQLWSAPVNLGPPVNGSADDGGICLSSDNLTLFIHSNRPGGYGGHDLYWTVWKSEYAIWSEPINLGSNINTSAMELRPSLTSDARMLYFGGFYMDLGSEIWQVSIDPIVDFNGDGIVDCADICIMVNHWEEDYPFCDIGPMPWGDGVVDVNDLIILAEHLFTYPGAAAYWKMDETEGSIAEDSAGDNNGIVFGDAVWQPDGGQVNGALQFDGIDDYVSTPFVLNPADGPFSVFAWVKGGAPGQVIVSQTGGSDWLLADPVTGTLMTDLKDETARSPRALQSQVIITDGDWHRVGLVWDGSQRMLYVDDIEVATDTQNLLTGSDDGLHIGAGKALEPGSFWSGLIDDVRIYNRAISP